jgi:ubiquinone/menaquinone biosynthesis C-methylase UbiE
MDALVKRQYGTSDPLRVRIETHLRHSEKQGDLDEVCFELMGLMGPEAILEVGFGRGTFLRYIRQQGHQGRLVGVDQSPTMVAESQAASEGITPEIEWRVGEANALDFPNGCFDWLVARHMLYHVPDIPGALRGFIRVVGPEGRLLFTTNSERSLPLLHALRKEALEALGLPPRQDATSSFTVENAREVLEPAGLNVEEYIGENAFVFTEPEPLVAYIATMEPFLKYVRDSPPLWEKIERWLYQEIERQMGENGGVWRDPKYGGVFLCRPKDSTL